MPAHLAASDPHYAMRAAVLVPVALAVLALPEPPAAHAGRGVAALKLLADDTANLVVIDVAKGRKSTVFTKGYAFASDKVAQLSIVPLDKVDTVLAGQTSKGDFVVVLEGKVDAIMAETKKRSTGSAKHGTVTYWSLPELDVALIDKRVVLVTTGTMPAVIDRGADKKRAKGPTKLRGWLASSVQSAAVVVAGAPDANVAKDLTKQLGAVPQNVVVSVATTSNLTIDARLKFADEPSAEAARKGLEGALSPEIRSRVEAVVGKEFADSIHISRDQAAVRASAVMTGEEVDKILGLARMLM